MNLATVEPGWWWAVGGVLLLIAEVIAPGFFLMFIGVAALATGLFTLLFGLGIAPQVALFVVYAALAVAAGKRLYARPAINEPGAIALNDRRTQLIGRSATAIAVIDSHGGRVRLGDSEWSARGGPAEPGDWVVIRQVDGNCLIVERPPETPSARA